jgi:deoxycytidylate deaminase
MKYDLDAIMKIAEQEAMKSDCKYKVSCILVDDRGNVVATGYNHHSLNGKKNGQPTVHAEVDAISKGIMKPSRNLTAFVYRLNGRKIHPCDPCAKLLHSYGIRTVFCTNDDFWVKIRPGETLEDGVNV